MSFNDIGKFLGENAACEIITTINRKKITKNHFSPIPPTASTPKQKDKREIH